ncbi:uncharacterized protein LOC114317480 [Camellia sinensis]|uniref:uncharacterized protein LOC114317480 n=1 Tax=Camellia sinensis TaxID=4442 RepID=UPI0010356926|nr:uncharacterized protein LOC114317480 [Camellia sinensis]
MVIVSSLNGTKVQFKGDRQDSLTPTCRKSRWHDQLTGWLASLILEDENRKHLGLPHAVCEYTGVFPDELPKLPPKRDVDFTIELQPGTSPISIAPHCIAPAELQELKEQLQELLNKNFIRPMDLAKVEAVMGWKQPKNTFGIRRFLGLAGYYRRFIQNFSKLAKPMTLLTQKGVKFEWNETYEQSFQELKKRLTNASILIIPERDIRYTVYYDASKEETQNGKGRLFAIVTTPQRLTKVLEAQGFDQETNFIKARLVSGKSSSDWMLHQDGSLRYLDKIFVPNIKQLREKVLKEFHHSGFAIHLGGNKMYQELKRQYGWSGMKKDITQFVSKCLTCQQVKAEHQKPAGKLQPLPIPEWKWEHMTIDFVTRLPRSRQGHDAIWVVVNRLTKMIHFLALGSTDTLESLSRLFIREIIRLHGELVSIVSDCDSRFTSQFQQSLQKAMGTELCFSTAFHSQTDG